MSTETSLEQAMRDVRRQEADLRAFAERGYRDEYLKPLYDRGVHPDLIMMRLWAYPCSVEVLSHWDQWMVTFIECGHGRYRGTSAGPANPIGQSLATAFKAFLRDDHGICDEHRAENDAADDMTDTCVVCKKELLLW